MYFNFRWCWNVTVVYHWALGFVMREQNIKLITLLTNLKNWIQSLPQTDAKATQVISKLWCDLICTLCYSCWIGTGGRGRSRPPQTKIFSHQCGGHLQRVGGLTPPPNAPTNRTLVTNSAQSQTQSLQDVFRATVPAKLTYCSPTWSGYCTTADLGRLGGFLRRCRRLGYCEQRLLNFSVTLMIHFSVVLCLILHTFYNRFTRSYNHLLCQIKKS